MKRFKRNTYFTISKLGHCPYNRLRSSNQGDEDEKMVLHFSYNLAVDAEQAGYYHLAGELDFDESTTNNPEVSSQRCGQDTRQKTSESKNEESSLRHLFNNEDDQSLECPKAGSQMIFYGGATHGRYVQEKSTEISRSVIEEKTNRSSGVNSRRKLGLGEVTNVSLMSHRLRKKAVCDYTDNSHYQRQFLRVLNKRF